MDFLKLCPPSPTKTVYFQDTVKILIIEPEKQLKTRRVEQHFQMLPRQNACTIESVPKEGNTMATALIFRFAFILTFIATTAGIGCSTLRKTPGQRLPASAEQELSETDRAILQFQELAEEALVWRAIAAKYAPILAGASKSGHLTHDQLEALHKSGSEYLELRKKIMALAKDSEWMVDSKSKVKFNPGSGTSVVTEDGFFTRKRTVVNLDPSDAEGRKILTELKMSAAAALLLYDNYLIGVYPYWENRKLRYLLNKDHLEKSNQLKKVTESFLNKKSRKKVARALGIIEKDLEWKTAQGQQTGKPEQYLELLIQQSPTFSYLEAGAFKKVGPKRDAAVLVAITEDLGFLGKAFSYVTSKLFGNSVGLIEFRKGYLTKLSDSERAGIANQLEPLDVLLEKTPFRLTDKFIPGHWGHVAIWVGNEQQLTELGVWNDPAVVPYQDAVRNGHMIVEALRPGVEINTLEHFLNIDDIGALRHRNLTMEQRREYVIRTFQQIGKAYDFNFDVETDKRIVCSELAYVVYHNVDWPTSKALGRYTISPDNVAVQAIGGGPFDPVIIYHEGKRVPDQRLNEILPLLLEERYKEVDRILN